MLPTYFKSLTGNFQAVFDMRDADKIQSYTRDPVVIDDTDS